MGRLFSIWYAFFLIGAWALFTMARVNDGGVLIMSFQGDALHMAQTVLRVAAGEVPHSDFQTPLGAMAFLPISGLMGFGYGLGKAFAYAPSLLAAVSLPAVYWLGLTRFNPKPALLFATVFLAMMFAFIHGGLLPSATVSMYYNNWCWAVAMLVVTTAVLRGPEGRASFWVEVVILGVGMGFLTLTKATYAVFLLPAVVLSLSMGKDWMKLAASVGTSLVFLAVFTLPLGGITYWLGYINDLQTVMTSPTRAQPGLGLNELMVSARHLPGALAMLAAVIFLRQAKLMREGLVFLLLGFGWMLITYQNWENDPHWMVLAGLLLFPMAANIELYNNVGWPLRSAIRSVGIILLVLGLPLSYTQLQSVILHNGLNADSFTKTLPINQQADLRFRGPKQGVVWVKTPHALLTDEITEAKVSRLDAEVLPNCRKENGLFAEMQASGILIGAIAGTAGKSTIYADWVNSLWMFSDLEPLQGGAPWYYGGSPGFENADYLVVPLCPMGPSVRRLILEEIAADSQLNFTEIARNELFILLEKTSP